MSEDIQLRHYDNISQIYDDHYGDEFSYVYREKFVYGRLFGGIKTEDAVSLDAMCAGGYATEYLLNNGAKVRGIDISENLIQIYNSKFPDAKGQQGSVFEMPFEDGTFDIVSVIGGFHHLHPNVEKALDEFFRILKPGGHLCCFEPPSKSIADYFRKIWYKKDRYFEENEESIDVAAFVKYSKKYADLDFVSYGGGPAYYLVFNSMILRMPKIIKKVVAPIVTALEPIFEAIIPAFLAGYVLIRMRKKN